ncbi:hypothetical protein ABEL47_01710 [Escherichia coli]
MINTISRTFSTFEAAQAYATGFNDMKPSECHIDVIQEDEFKTRVTITPNYTAFSYNESDIESRVACLEASLRTTNTTMVSSKVSDVENFSVLVDRVKTLEADKEAREKANAALIDILKDVRKRLSDVEKYQTSQKEDLNKIKANVVFKYYKDNNEIISKMNQH